MPLACDAPLGFQLGRCRSVKEFEKLNRIGEGTYGIVCKCGAGCSLRAWGRASSWVGCSPSACILAAGSVLGWGWGVPAGGPRPRGGSSAQGSRWLTTKPLFVFWR